MNKTIILTALISMFSITSASAGWFSWGVSIGFGGGCGGAVYVPPVYCAPTTVVYTAPVVCSTPVVYTQPAVVYTQPVAYVPPPAPVCTVPVVNYYRPDCYRSPVTGTVWVGGASGGGHNNHHNRHHGRR